MPIFKVEGVVTLGGGFALRVRGARRDRGARHGPQSRPGRSPGTTPRSRRSRSSISPRTRPAPLPAPASRSLPPSWTATRSTRSRCCSRSSMPRSVPPATTSTPRSRSCVTGFVGLLTTVRRNPMNKETNPNPWSLYSTQSGWRDCANRLDHALAIALQALDDKVVDGHTLVAAACKAHAWMLLVMREESNQRYGAFDSEPIRYMERKVGTHIKARYGVEVNL